MAQPAATPPYTSFAGATLGLPPYSSRGTVYRTLGATATGSSFALDVTNNSLSGCTGLLNVIGVSNCSVPAYAYLSDASASRNSDGTLGVLAGPWTITSSDTRACDFQLTVISRT